MYLVIIIIFNFKEDLNRSFPELRLPGFEISRIGIEIGMSRIRLELKLIVKSRIEIGIENDGIVIELRKWNWPQPWKQDITLCVATLKGLFVKCDYSHGVTDGMSISLRPSSIGCYEVHWNRFIEYCWRKHLDVFEIVSCSFSKYLLYLFEVECYAPSTIISHQTSIASTLWYWQYDPDTDPCMRALFRHFQLTSSTEIDVSMGFASCPDSPVATSIHWRFGRKTQWWWHWPKMVDAQNNILVVAGHCQEEIVSARCVCVSLPLLLETCRTSWLSICYHRPGFLRRIRCRIRFPSGYAFPALLISTEMSGKECCVPWHSFRCIFVILRWFSVDEGGV